MKNISSQKFLYGIYRGIVEYNYDPLQLGRCKVRVPALHGDMDKSLLNILPWARPKYPTPSGNDSGTFIVPEVGMSVWVQFEGGDKLYPIYEGGSHGIVGGKNEVPRESLEGMESVKSPRDKDVFRPTAWTLFKSPKGTSINGQEGDGRESVQFIDRSGQEFKSRTEMKSGLSPRGEKHKISGQSYTYDDTLSNKISTVFKSFSGGFIKFISERFKERVDVLSRSLTKPDKHAGISFRSYEDKTEAVVVAQDGVSQAYMKVDAEGVVEIGVGNQAVVIVRDGEVSIPATVKVETLHAQHVEVGTMNVSLARGSFGIGSGSPISPSSGEGVEGIDLSDE